MDLHDAVTLSLLACGDPRRMLALRRDLAARSGTRTLPATELLHAPAVAGGVAEARRRADTALARASRARLTVVALGDGCYPPLLAAIPDPPFALWIRGAVSALAGPAVAVVGARSASPYALEVAARLGSDLAARGVIVVSGLARGVDGAAHQGALDGCGRTLAVLGSGVDVVYPYEHAALGEAIVAAGALVSELPPGAPPRRFHFPWRNRIISGLARATVVVEASLKSGSLITARCGLEQGREVMAVPGNVMSDRNRGAHALIKDGAKIVEDVDDILEELMPAFRAAARPADVGTLDDPLLEHMCCGEAYDLDALITLTGSDGTSLIPRLLQLELRGLVRRSGGRFVRSSGRW